MPNDKSFRHWCQEKWYEHVDESISWEGFSPTATAQEYFEKYKYWLKREYKYQAANASTGNLSEQ